MPDQRDPTKEEIDALVAAAKAVYGIALECCHPTSDVFEWATVCRRHLLMILHAYDPERNTDG